MSRKEKGIRKFKFVTKTQFFWIFVGGLLWISIGWIRMNELIDENKDGRKKEWMEGRMDGRKKEWMEGWMDQRMNEYLKNVRLLGGSEYLNYYIELININ